MSSSQIFLNFTWTNPSSEPIPLGDTAAFSFNCDKTRYEYKMYGLDKNSEFNPQPNNDDLATWTSNALYHTTTFTLECYSGETVLAQQSITVPVAGAEKRLLKSVNVTADGQQNTTWVSLALPPTYSSFEVALDNLMPMNSASIAIAQLQFDSTFTGSGYTGTGWGNDSGSNGFFEYYEQPYISLWPIQRGGPCSGTGVSGSILIRNTRILNAYSCIESRLFAPQANNHCPGSGFVGSYCSNQAGAANAIRIGFGYFSGGNPPSKLDTVNAGILSLYGWN